MTHSSDTFMLDLLKRAQPYQAELLKGGFSAHFDASHGEFSFDTGHYISFDVTVFEGSEIIKTFYFSPFDTEEENEALLTELVAFVNSHC